jgi:MerR family mercuric resistance operon transcriptional regulator
VMADMAARCTGNRVPQCPVIDALFDSRPASRGRRSSLSL